MGFPPDQRAVYRAHFLRLQLCLSGAQGTLGDPPAGLEIPVGTCHTPRPAELLRVSWPLAPTAGTFASENSWDGGELFLPLLSSASVTFSDGSPKMIP